MAGAVVAPGRGGDEGRIASTASASGSAESGGDLRDGAAQTTSSLLGAAQDSSFVSADAWTGGFGKQLQTDPGQGGNDRATSTPASVWCRRAVGERAASPGSQRDLDGGLQGLVV